MTKSKGLIDSIPDEKMVGEWYDEPKRARFQSERMYELLKDPLYAERHSAQGSVNYWTRYLKVCKDPERAAQYAPRLKAAQERLKAAKIALARARAG